MAQFIKGEKMKKILHELNYLKIENIFNIIIFLLSLLPTIIYKIYIKISKKRIWLICEDPLEARDNGFSFFKYLRNNYNEIDTYYAIKYKSADSDCGKDTVGFLCGIKYHERNNERSCISDELLIFSGVIL